MKKYLVIGNPIDHSLSPQLHNYWIKKNKINAIYESEKLNSDDLKSLVLKIRDESISGVNVTIPFKKEIRVLSISFATFINSLLKVSKIYLTFD